MLFGFARFSTQDQDTVAKKLAVKGATQPTSFCFS